MRPVTAPDWRKAAASGASDCVEVAWVTAAASAASNCVEVAPGSDEQILVRNSRDPGGPVLAFTRAEFGAFVAGCKGGEFDQLVAGGQPATPARDDWADGTVT